jgi:hypothetical protein
MVSLLTFFPQQSHGYDSTNDSTDPTAHPTNSSPASAPIAGITDGPDHSAKSSAGLSAAPVPDDPSLPFHLVADENSRGHFYALLCLAFLSAASRNGGRLLDERVERRGVKRIGVDFDWAGGSQGGREIERGGGVARGRWVL